MAIITIGIDLAKNVFAVHGVDEHGKPALVRPSVKRDALLELIAKLPACLIGIEACSGAHYWAREFGFSAEDQDQAFARYSATTSSVPIVSDRETAGNILVGPNEVKPQRGR